MKQNRLIENQKDDDFVKSLALTQGKIKQDMEKMKALEGFPKGDDEDILELSNPPYYTAYPNPYLTQFVQKYGKPYNSETDNYKKEPFVGDISEGKNDPIYLTHCYHTKVPYKAIEKFIVHYTDPGDIILDGFCGTGMTGIAASTTKRRAILLDLSPAATFIAFGYNFQFLGLNYGDEAAKIVDEIEKEYGWMFETVHDERSFSQGKMGKIIYSIWSDVFICPHCSNEYVFWDTAVNVEIGKIKDQYFCPSCSANISTSKGKGAYEKVYDPILGEEVILRKQKQVYISYVFQNKRYSKRPDKQDDEILKKIESNVIPYWFPINRMPEGDESRRNDKRGITNIHQFYSLRNLLVLSAFAAKMRSPTRFFNVTSVGTTVTKRYRFVSQGAQFGAGGGPMSGTLYVPSLNKELSMIKVLREHINKTSRLQQFLNELKPCLCISTQSASSLRNVPKNSVDYIFTDPPFGGNLMYSELNFMWEAWLKVFTNNKEEAIINNTQNKTLNEYRQLMTNSFKEYFDILKPNRWITIEFHNSQASVWKCIHEAIVKAGFIIGQVAVLDKKQTTFKQVTSAGSVKNDLIINAYKPSDEFRVSFLKKGGLNLEKEFIEVHLEKLPVEPNIERSRQMLYSKLLAQYIQNGFEVRIDASEFYGLLRNNFMERDGFWFNKEQISEYEKRLKLKKSIGKFNLDQTVLGIDSEKTAIIWLSQFLRIHRSYGEVSIEYNKNLLTSDDKIPELKLMLEENFVTETGKYRLPSIAEKKEKEDMRDKRLNKEFQQIVDETKAGEKIFDVRKEALLHGLIQLYNKKDVDQIRAIGKKLDSKVIQSDDEIYAIIDWALSKDD